MLKKDLLHAAIVNYMADPFDNRTWEQVFSDFGCSKSSGDKYRRENRDAINRDADLLRKKFISEARASAYKSLLARTKNDTQALRLFFQLAQDLVERSEVRTETLSAEDKRARIKRLLEETLRKSDKESLDGAPDTDALG